MKTCHWEQCTEKATETVRWHREAPTLADQKRAEADVAHYCLAHAHMAKTHGASEVK